MTSKKNRLAFLGSDEIALPILRFLNSTSSTVDVAAILTQPDRRSGRGGKKSPNEIKKWADENSIPCESPEKPSIDECEWLKAKNVDILLVMAYGHILKENFWILHLEGATIFTLPFYLSIEVLLQLKQQLQWEKKKLELH